MKLFNREQIVNGKKYRTETASVVADNVYWDGHNFERSGTNTWLLKTPRGNFFLQHQTCWQGERDYIQPVTLEQAKEWYERLSEHSMEYAEAFGQDCEEA